MTTYEIKHVVTLPKEAYSCTTEGHNRWAVSDVEVGVAGEPVGHLFTVCQECEDNIYELYEDHLRAQESALKR